MREKKTTERSRKAKRQGKAATTQPGELVHEEIEHVRRGKHGAKNAKQAIAIGLSRTRRAGVRLPAPKKAATSEGIRRKAKRDTTAGKKASAKRKSAKRARAVKVAVERQPRVASSRALSRQGRPAAPRRKKRSTSTRHRKRSTPRARRSTSE